MGLFSGFTARLRTFAAKRRGSVLPPSASWGWCACWAAVLAFAPIPAGAAPEPYLEVQAVSAAAPSQPADALDAQSGATLDAAFRTLQKAAFQASEAVPNFPREQPLVAPGPEDFWIALEDAGTDEAYQASIGPLIEALERAFPKRRVVVSAIPSRDFAAEVTRRGIPFVAATAGTMVSLMQTSAAVPLAARERSEKRFDAQTSAAAPAGGLLVVRADSPVKKLSDLEDRRLAVQSSVSFGPWQRLQGRLLAAGFDEKHFFSDVVWRAHDLPDVVNAVLYGSADAGLLTTCAYERMVKSGLLDPLALRPAALTDEAAEGRLACLSSTPLYPDWTVGYTPTAGHKTLREFAAVLFAMPATENYRWGLRVDLSGVQSLMQTLHFGPYSYLDEEPVSAVLARHKGEIGAALLLLALLILHSIRTNYLVRVRTRELSDALEQKDRMAEAAKRTRERLSAVERVGVISQMGSMFAHEMKQPLAAITNYLGGLQIWNKMRQASAADKAVAGEALSAAQAEAARAAAIVERVRGYAKAQTAPFQLVDLTATVRGAVSIVAHHDTQRTPIWAAPGDYFGDDAPAAESGGASAAAAPAHDRPAFVMGDPVELELLALNLIRNACRAALERDDSRNAFVAVSLTKEDKNLVLRVIDNGPTLNDEQFERLTVLSDAVKSRGLGIGLSICRGIADRHGGTLSFERVPGGGISAEVRLEAAQAAEDAQKHSGRGQ